VEIFGANGLDPFTALIFSGYRV